MLARTSPHEAYRRVEFDARVSGADPAGLVLVCFEQFDRGLAAALGVDKAGDNHRRSAGLTSALAAVTALQLGIDRTSSMAAALEQYYGAARAALLDSVLHFRASTIATLRADFAEVAGAMVRR
ncbi:MAG: flagellin [Novosphingobium sp.]